MDMLLNKSNEELCTLIKSGDRNAAQQLCIKNEKVVTKYANKFVYYLGNKLDIDDLKQAGYLGLMKAANKYNPESSNTFITYAVYWIIQVIVREITNTGMDIRIPGHMCDKIVKYMKYEKENRDLVSGEFSRKDIENIRNIRHTFMNCGSLNASVGDDQDAQIIDFIHDEDTDSVETLAEKRCMISDLREAVLTLTPVERNIISKRFGLEDGVVHTLVEIGNENKVSRERIRQIEQAALQKLRKIVCGKDLKEYIYA